MTYDKRVQVVQNRLAHAGFNVGKAGADGLWGDDTYNALIEAFDTFKIGTMAPPPPATQDGFKFFGPLPAAWLDKSKMSRIICHWSAGGYVVSDVDKEHYHFIAGGDAKWVRGDHTVADNLNTGDGDYAAHTLGCNTGSIGISLACMAGAIESPFKPGPYPMKREQWTTLVAAVAQLVDNYQIPVNPKTVLSHAEVQQNLGITQRGKWDYTRLPFDPSVVGAKAVGDKLRAEVMALLK